MARNAIQNRFETLFRADGGPSEMLLIEQAHMPAVSTLWLRLANERLRSAFPELDPVHEATLPRKAALLVGQNAEFEELFEYDEED